MISFNIYTLVLGGGFKLGFFDLIQGGADYE